MTYARVTGHSPMLFDDRRNDAYVRAIRKLVTPESIVIDVGAGLGELGLAAAAAGAAHVYLVDPQPLVHCAREVAAAAQLLDRVTIVQEKIEHTTLPVQADLIVSVLTGNLLFSEDLLPALFQARDRLLKPGGHLIPDRAQLWIAPVVAPRFHAERIGRWSQPVAGLDYSNLRRFAANDIALVRGNDLAEVSQLAEGALISELDLAQATRAECDASVTSHIARTGDCHALIGWIRMRLHDEWLSSGPGQPALHWSPALFPLDPPLPLEKGEHVTIRIHRPEHGEWTWWVKARSGMRRHSTFLARSEGPREFDQASRGA